MSRPDTLVGARRALDSGAVTAVELLGGIRR